MQRIILHLDMNSYFATVEQQANPYLRGKPVGVCAYLSENGTIIAPSIEAKARGVKTAMRVRDARKLCPEVILVENEPAKYRHISTQLFSLLAEYSDNVSPYSIDEAFVDLTGWVASFDQARVLAETIKQRIQTEIGRWLKCSIGISFTHWLAKFASEEQKPDGLTIITQPDISTIFINRPLQHATGIAQKLESRLFLAGIHTLGQLQKADPHTLMQILGKYGYFIWCHVNGIEVKGWIKRENAEQKSIGHSYCVPKQGKDKEYLRKVLFKLCERTGRRLRKKGLVARTVSSGWDYVGKGPALGPSTDSGRAPSKGEWRRHKLPYPIFTTQDIFEQAVDIFDKAFFLDDVRIVAVNVSSLSPFSSQLSFWHNDSARYQLGKTMDELNNKYGEYTVYPGRMFGMESQARDRIGYRKSVDVLRPL